MSPELVSPELVSAELVSPELVLAHGIGGRSDLPLDGAVAAVGAALAVAVSFLALSMLRERPWLDPDRRVALPAGAALAAAARALRGPLRVLVAAVAVLVVAVALLGPPDPGDNLAPWVLYTWFWVGIAFASALLGPVWRALNPLRTAHRLLAAAVPSGPPAPLPERIGLWPAAAGLALFVWLELVAPFGADPRAVGGFLLVHAAGQLAAARRFGEEWFARGDPFEVYSTLLGRLSPLGRDAAGALALRNPVAALRSVEPLPGLAAVLVVLIGSTVFDGVTRTSLWAGLGTGVVGGTLGLVAAVALVAVLHAVATRPLVRRPAPVGAPGSERVPVAAFAATLVPIALGYTVAHYFSFLLLEGQTVAILASDPFGWGWDLVATRDRTVDYAWLAPALVATVQLNAVLLGHVAATAAAHDLALCGRPAHRARRDQIPQVAVMVALTGLAILLLLSG